MFNNTNNNNDPETNIQHNNESSDEAKMSYWLLNLTYMTIALAILRILNIDILLMISDLLSALMLFFFYKSKTKCMAIMCLINGVVGIIYALIKIIPAFKVPLTLYTSLLFLVLSYAIIVYSLICYVSAVGYNKCQATGFPGGMGMSGQRQSPTAGTAYGDYGAAAETKPLFTAFSGKGTTIG